MFGFVAANPNVSKLAAIDIAGTGDKNYTTAPVIVIAEPTAKDALVFCLLMSSSAEFFLLHFKTLE